MNAPSRDIEAALGLNRPNHRRWTRAVLLLGVVVALAGSGWWLLGGPAPEAVPYAAEPATRAPLTVTVVATGTVEPTNLVEISSELSGAVREVLVDSNDSVRVGQPLAQLDTSKLDAQIAHSRAALAVRLARVAEAEATLAEAREQHARIVSLTDRAVATAQALEQAVAALRRAEAALAVARADVDVARADLKLDETNLAKACICAPIDGVVLERNVDVGQVVAASFQAPVLFTIAEDLRQMELRVDVDEADMGRVATGQTALFTVEAYPGRSFPAAIAEVRYAPKTVDGVVTYEAVLTIDNADLSLRPGMTATAEITVAHVPDALTVPNAALRFAPPPEAEGESRSGAGLLGLILPRRSASPSPVAVQPPDPEGWRTLWRLSDGKAEPVRVRAGESDGLRTEIVEGPLAPGDAVITDMARP